MPELRAEAFEAIRRIVYQTAGIQLTDAKHALVASRLNKRLTRLGCKSFDEYVEALTKRDANGAELREMINCITTNKTDFFRESHHFDFLRDRVLEEVRARVAKGGPRRLRIWSAGCSTGEEPWTIAMVVADALRGQPGWDVKILASDIDTQVLARAAEGRYDADRLDPIPERMREAYFKEEAGEYRVRDELRDLVAFRRINFMDDPWPVRTKFDAIFCRNVTIYFDRPTQDRFYHRLVKFLDPHSYLFAGHSENLSWLADVLTPVGNTIYVPIERGLRRQRRTRAPGALHTLPPIGTSASEAEEARASRRPPKGNSMRPPKGGSIRPPKGSSMRPPRGPSMRPPKAPSLRPPKPPPKRKISIQSGAVLATNEDVRLRTVLGTCVTACLWDEEAGVGGMNHFMLPDGEDPSAPARFGVHAMELLINDLMRKGADRKRLKAKAFGAAQVLQSSLGANVAARNEAFVRAFLATEKIPLIVAHFGGNHAMEVEFEVKTGRAFVRQVAREGVVTAAEERYRRTLEKSRGAAGDAELF